MLLFYKEVKAMGQGTHVGFSLILSTIAIIYICFLVMPMQRAGVVILITFMPKKSSSAAVVMQRSDIIFVASHSLDIPCIIGL